MAANRDLPTRSMDDILVVDDTVASLRVMAEILSKAGYKPRPVEDPQLALKAALAQPPDLILLDVRMPKMSGFELSRLLKKDERTKDVPIIFVSALEDTPNRVLGFESGGVDFISKPYQEAEILARVDTHMQLRNMQLGLEGIVEERTAELHQKNKTLKKEIEKRIRAEKQIRLSEEKFRGVFNSMIDVFTRSNMDGICLMASPSIYNLIGYTQEEVIGKNIRNFYAIPNERGKIIQQLRKSEKVENFEFDALHKNGNRIPVSTNARIVYDDKGNPLYVEGNIRDISEQKKAESEHNKLFNVSFDLLCIAGMDGYFKELNPAWESAMGYSLDELYSRPFNDFVHPDDVEKTASEIAVIEDGKSAIDFNNRYITKNGEVIHLSWTAIPVLEEKRMYCIARDVTRRIHAEEQIIKHQRRLKDLTQQLTISEELVRKQIAIDLHDHVGQMLSSTRMQMSRIIDAEENPELIIRIKSISQALLRAIQATRAAIFDLSPPQLNEIGLVPAIKEWTEEQIEKKHLLGVSISDEIKNVVLDETSRFLLFRSIKELCINVVKHANAQRISIAFKEINGILEINVEDDGIGFVYNADLLKLKNDVYGLFSVEERMENMGGSMKVTSKENQGTIITLQVPINLKQI